MKTTEKQLKLITRIAESILCPNGFTKTVSPDDNGYGKPLEDGSLKVELKTSAVELTIHIHPVEASDYSETEVEWYAIDRFRSAAGGWRTFWRRGIDTGVFSGGIVRKDAKLSKAMRAIYEKDVNVQIDTQLGRIAEAVDRSTRETRLPAPFANFVATPEKLEEYRKTIAAKRSLRLTPAGFGTGYEIAANRLGLGRFAKRAAGTEIERAFGVPVVYYSTLDCD